MSIPANFKPTRLLYYDDSYMKEFEAQVIGIVENKGRKGVVLDQTAFYPGGGGQPPDRGFLFTSKGEVRIINAQMINKGVVIHFFEEGAFLRLSLGETVKGLIDWEYRYAIMRNYTSAHLMAEAVRQAIGEPVEIVGSGLEADKARLDFAYHGSIRPFFPKIEEISNKIVRENRPVTIKLMGREEAERYVKRFHESLKTLPSHVSRVRIVEIEGWHACACGGLHVKRTGEISLVKLLSRASKGRGVERIEFVSS